MKDSSLTDFGQKLTTLQSQYPHLPAVPRDPLRYEGWFTQVIKQLELESVTKVVTAEIKLTKQINALYDEHLRYVNTTGAIQLHAQRQTASQVNLEAEIIEATNRVSAAKAAGQPPVQSEAEKFKVENDAIRAQIELERSKAELASIRNPPPPPQPKAATKREGFAEKVAREFEEEAEARVKIMEAAEALAKKYPNMSDRIMRDAKKQIEAMRERA